MQKPAAETPKGSVLRVQHCGFSVPQAAQPHLGRLVRQQRVLGSVLAVGPGLEFRQVAVVVALHLQVEHL